MYVLNLKSDPCVLYYFMNCLVFFNWKKLENDHLKLWNFLLYDIQEQWKSAMKLQRTSYKASREYLLLCYSAESVRKLPSYQKHPRILLNVVRNWIEINHPSIVSISIFGWGNGSPTYDSCIAQAWHLQKALWSHRPSIPWWEKRNCDEVRIWIGRYFDS